MATAYGRGCDGDCVRQAASHGRALGRVPHYLDGEEEGRRAEELDVGVHQLPLTRQASLVHGAGRQRCDQV